MTTQAQPLPIYFAPLQGQTDRIYRSAHQQLVGGVAAYYTPFLRWEHGEVRGKDLRDVSPTDEGPSSASDTAAARLAAWVPQIIAKDAEEMARLCDALQGQGYRRIDLNLGCPFPMQVHRGRGCGLLPHPDRVEALLREAERRSDCRFSVKMRLGEEQADECLALLPLLNDSPLCCLTLHPRTGRQQYKGHADRAAFRLFYEQCRKPLIYNGDLTAAAQVAELAADFPHLAGIMIGRGLLAQPTLALEIAQGHPLSEAERMHALLRLHDAVRDWAVLHLQGDSQILARLLAFWEYPGAYIDKKSYKQLRKSHDLRQYNAALQTWRRQLPPLPAAKTVQSNPALPHPTEQ